MKSKDIIRIHNVIRRIAYPGLRFEFSPANGVRVVCEDGADSRTGEAASWKGRWWRLSGHMTDGEIAQTCLLAVLTATEHEARERFKVDGVPVFDPHYELEALIALRKDPRSIAERGVADG